jgi:hypothetical protein
MHFQEYLREHVIELCEKAIHNTSMRRLQLENGLEDMTQNNFNKGDMLHSSILVAM